MNVVTLESLTAAVATGYNAIAPAVQPYAYLAIGVGITFIVIGFAVSLFKKNVGGSSSDKELKAGYYTGRIDPEHYDKDQALGKMIYDVQTKGVWIK